MICIVRIVGFIIFWAKGTFSTTLWQPVGMKLNYLKLIAFHALIVSYTLNMGVTYNTFRTM